MIKILFQYSKDMHYYIMRIRILYEHYLGSHLLVLQSLLYWFSWLTSPTNLRVRSGSHNLVEHLTLDGRKRKTKKQKTTFALLRVSQANLKSISSSRMCSFDLYVCFSPMVNINFIFTLIKTEEGLRTKIRCKK